MSINFQLETKTTENGSVINIVKSNFNLKNVRVIIDQTKKNTTTVVVKCKLIAEKALNSSVYLPIFITP